MSLYDPEECPHLISLYSSDYATYGGGQNLTFSLEQSGIKCSINTGGAHRRSQFDQNQMVVTGRVAILSEQLTTIPKRGWKAIAEDTNQTLMFTGGGVSAGREYGTVPPFTYLDIELWL